MGLKWVNAEGGRWRFFRHEAGRAAGPSPYAYVALFALCLSVADLTRLEG